MLLLPRKQVALKKLDDTVEKTLQTLEGCALVHMQEFESKCISATLHIMAKTRYSNARLLYARAFLERLKRGLNRALIEP